MCGIAGMIGWKGPMEDQASILKAMQSTLRRRGPDQEGLCIDGPAALAHTRRCVVDLENGKQPMRCSQGNEEYGLVYNGELCSTSELRTELESLGHSFLGHSDTEVYFLQVNYWLQKFNIRIVSLAFA